MLFDKVIVITTRFQQGKKAYTAELGLFDEGLRAGTGEHATMTSMSRSALKNGLDLGLAKGAKVEAI